MATRQEIQQSIDSNVYDNVNKEIQAQMVREVFELFKDSYFNLEEDELANLQYNAQQTLQQRLNGIPVIKTTKIGAFGFGSTGSVDIDGDDLFLSASIEQITAQDCVITVNTSESILGKKKWVSLETDAPGNNGLNSHNDTTFPVIFESETNQLKISFREINDQGSDFYLNLFIL